MPLFRIANNERGYKFIRATLNVSLLSHDLRAASQKHATSKVRREPERTNNPDPIRLSLQAQIRPTGMRGRRRSSEIPSRPRPEMERSAISGVREGIVDSCQRIV